MSLVPLHLLTEKRAEIVNLLKRRGGLTAGSLASELKISAVAVRRHLERLEARGMVTHVLEQGDRGRPGFVYQLTDRAAGLFPDTSPELACDLLAEVDLAFGAGASTRVIARRADKVIDAVRADLEPLPFAERVRWLARHFNEMGFVTDVEQLDDGSFLVVEHNCPTREVAERYPQLCAEELRVYAELSGGVVERSCRLADGGAACAYKIAPGRTGARRLPVLRDDRPRVDRG